jgi:hypothetical protein
MPAFAKKKQPTLTEEIRRVADMVRAVDADCKGVIELWLDAEKASLAGAPLPRESHRQMLMAKFQTPWHAVLGLEAERAHEQ